MCLFINIDVHGSSVEPCRIHNAESPPAYAQAAGGSNVARSNIPRSEGLKRSIFRLIDHGVNLKRLRGEKDEGSTPVLKKHKGPGFGGAEGQGGVEGQSQYELNAKPQILMFR